MIKENLAGLVVIGVVLAGTVATQEDANAAGRLAAKEGAQATGMQSSSTMHWMAFNGDAAGVKELIIAGESVNGRLKTGGTPLHLAAYKGHVEVARVLIEHGAQVDAKTREGVTPLDWAQRNGHEKVAMLLIAHGAGQTRSPEKQPPAPVAAEVGQRQEEGQENKHEGQDVRQEPTQGDKEQARMPQSAEPQKSDTPVQEIDGDVSAAAPESVVEKADIKAPSEPVAAPESVVEKTDIKAPSEPAAAPGSVAEKADIKAPSEPSASSTGYRIQLGAFSSEQRARDAWEIFRGKFPDALSERELIIDRASVKGKDYHRVQAGPMSRQDARDICNRLKGAGQACAVMRRASP